MQHSKRALDLVKEFEGCRLTAYKDGGGLWTIGYGHTPANENQVCTEEQAENWLDSDLKTADRIITKLVAAKLSQNQFDALVSFVYNIGGGNFSNSSLLKFINIGQSLLAANEFLRWDKIHGVESPGLKRRREAERALFLEGA